MGSNHTIRSANCLLLVFLLVLFGGSASSAQAPFFAFLSAEWMDNYWADIAASGQEEDVLLATLPDMFGDLFARGGTLTINDVPSFTTTTDVVLAGGSRGLKVAEQNKAIPMNRMYVTYNHFHNAGDNFDQSGAVSATSNFSIDRYTFGLERRFADDLWSLEVRMPFTGGYQFASPFGDVQHRAGEVGNLSLLLKRLVYYDKWTSISVGLGVETPTGDDFLSRASVVDYRISNDAVHLHPYIGALYSPNDRAFYHGFAQFDIATTGNGVTFNNGADVFAGRHNDQNLVLVDIGGGYWLHRNRQAPISGIAALLELHYTGTLNGADRVVGTPIVGVQDFTLTGENVNVVNLTTAVHVELGGNTNLRVGGVFPITSGADRFFDSEVAAQLIRRF